VEEDQPGVLPAVLDVGIEEPPETILENLGVGVASADPAALIAQIAAKLQAGDFDAVVRIIGREGLTPEKEERLGELVRRARLQLDEENPIREVGELEINKRSRWELNLRDEGRLYFDLARGGDGKWRVADVILPAAGGQPGIPRAVLVDALGIADSFLQATLRQDFETAKSFADLERLSDVRIAGLCIVFEEGEYRMREKNPLRGLYNRKIAAGFLANVVDREGEKAAQFGVNLSRATAGSPWRVTEINLDALLADYADRVAGGDVYYTPLLRNPDGGDTIVLYFEFDEDALALRSKRQLAIVARVLATDPERKIRISGHTDALGSKEYNRGLSRERAESVRNYLVECGVGAEQIVTQALGQSRPRLPNQTATGEDNPTGRRANRRTEIYLDF
jgi:outer membrane protein OmpA-like peptidoglycan-associated protein